jgi:hypothetical protein
MTIVDRMARWGRLACLTMLLVTCRSTGQTGAADGDAPSVGLYYEGTTGYVGHFMAAELNNDDEVCPLPWIATPRAVEGELPPGLSLVLPFGTIEGVPRGAGTWSGAKLVW